ncbi:MAG: SDR family oxidoreductase [Acidobacteriia bacterium]|nr:SDR family oxidoreductase [Terriglobia bacterium]
MLAVITGASSGLGAVFARKLAARGYDLLLIARREDRLQSLAREVGEQYHIRAEVLAADLTNDAALAATAARIRDAADLGLLVNNAGFGSLGYFVQTDPHIQEQMHRLHVLATMRLSHAALSNLLPRAKAGTGIINVSSVAAFAASPQSVSYGATKTWMNRFTEGLAMELAVNSSPVTMQALCPGFILTEFHDVVRMDRSRIPAAWWMTADFVVEDSLRGFDRGELFVVPGMRYKLLVWILRLLPGGLIRWGSIRTAQRFKQPKKPG